MNLFYFSIGLTILASILYHIFQKSTPANANPMITLMVTYLVSAVLCAAGSLLFFPLQGSLPGELSKLNWTSFALALAIVLFETGFLLAYRSGWNIGTAVIITNIVDAVLLIPFGILVFKEKITPLNMLGVIICLVGFILVNWKP
jgi:drug/metabolite transporter (DMT)-like permease